MLPADTKEGKAMAKDPVCGMSVVKNEDLKSLFEGNSFYFCSNNCKEGFDKNPVNFVENE